MNVKPVGNSTSSFVAQVQHKSPAEEFSKILDNLKSGKPANYDADAIKGLKTQTLTQILADGSTLVTVYDESGRVISQNKTAAVHSERGAQILSTSVENNFGLEELAAQNFFNFE